MRQAMDLSCEPEVGPEVLQRLRCRVRIKRDDTLGEYQVDALGADQQYGRPRFARRFGADRFLHVTVEHRLGQTTFDRQTLGRLLRPFCWLRRKWTLLQAKVAKPEKKRRGHRVAKETAPDAEESCSASL